MYGQKHTKIEMYVCIFGPKGTCFIVEIGPTYKLTITFRIEMYVENRKVGMYVPNPFLPDIYRRFGNIQTNFGGHKVVTSKCTLEV